MPVNQQRRTKRQKQQLEREKSKNQSGLQLGQIYPITDRQVDTFNSFDDNKNLFLVGSAGVGKTFLALYLGLREIFSGNSEYEYITIIRTAQASKNIGFLPGSEKEKLAVYEAPYAAICSELFNRGDAYEILKQKGIIKFESTSFLRGTTINNSIIVVDEFQGMCWNELNLVSTRVGDHSKIIYCGDLRQSDLRFNDDRRGHVCFYKILMSMNSIETIQFTENDIVRSGFCRDWIIACNAFEDKERISLTNL